MANVWPSGSGFPALPLYEGNAETAPATVIRTSMDVGPPKVRQRSTSGAYNYAYTYHMTKAHLDTLMTFYITTCAGGALAFEYTHPRLATTQSLRFTAPPSWSKITSTIYRVSISLEMLP